MLEYWVYWGTELDNVIHTTVYKEMFPKHVVPAICRHLQDWEPNLEIMDDSPQTIFAALHIAILLTDDEYGLFERSCLDAVLRPGTQSPTCVPVSSAGVMCYLDVEARAFPLHRRKRSASYIRDRVKGACRCYMLHTEVLSVLWGYLFTMYDD